MNIKRPFLFAVTALIILGCSALPQTTYQTKLEPVATESDLESAWWQDAIFYEIFVRSYYDTNGDGIGDFNGITQKLDYIESLGVNAVLLMPIHPSPSYHGYDVINYYAVNSQYGTMEDFKNLLNNAHKRNIKIIIDLVLNHTSSKHPFFIDANNNPQSLYHDWYVWSEKPGNHQHQGTDGYYYGFFGDHMPDLNYQNPGVTAQMENVTRYWLEDIGVDGFRLDAIKHLIEEGDKLENTESTHEWLSAYFTFYKSVDPFAYTVGEAWGAGAFLSTRYKGQMDQIFNFELANGFITSAQTGISTYINSALNFGIKDNPNFEFATFLTNHDQNRVMSVFDGDTQKAKLAAFLLLTSPGTPFIYYGEEIGMQGEKPDEDIRLPMQWNMDTSSGFTTGTPWRAPFANYPQVNVALQEEDSNSLLNFYRDLIKLRTEYPILRTGRPWLLETENTNVYAVLRMDSRDDMLLILSNLSEEPITDFALTLTNKMMPDGIYKPTVLFGSGQVQDLNVTQGAFQNYKPMAELHPYSTLTVQFHR